MLIHELANFVLTQAAADASADTGFLGTIAKRYNDGGWGMYPITICCIFFLAIVIDRSAMTVTKAGEDLQLTPTELRLLLELSRRPGQALSRQQLLRLVWEHDYLGDSRLVDACVQRLRAKIEDVPSSPTLIRTVRGVGYRLDTPQ